MQIKFPFLPTLLIIMFPLPLSIKVNEPVTTEQTTG